MKISEIKATYDDATSSLSTVARQLAFAGIAVVWAVRVGGDGAGGLQYDARLLLPLLFFVASLASDLLQYIYKSIAWGITNTRKWREKGDNQADVRVSGKLNYPTLGFFWTKVLLCGIGYFLLAMNLAKQLGW